MSASPGFCREICTTRVIASSDTSSGGGWCRVAGVVRPSENFSALALDETLAIFFDARDLAGSSCPLANPAPLLSFAPAGERLHVYARFYSPALLVARIRRLLIVTRLAS